MRLSYLQLIPSDCIMPMINYNLAIKRFKRALTGLPCRVKIVQIAKKILHLWRARKIPFLSSLFMCCLYLRFYLNNTLLCNFSYIKILMNIL
ncbi:hypothetical protein Leryth_008776 [Lithospermum erythrorhizon]|nr:hypothetical protein Leryth_008776 [Lithospermum erythrorhizon]